MIKEATKFVTFYSYKGGVGRTSALFNAAVVRALDGNNVIVIDFDLEAPGVTQYVRRIHPNVGNQRTGILEYIAAVIDGSPSPSLSDRAIDLSSVLHSSNGGHLWFISAGNTDDPRYTARLEKLKWSEIFENKFGEMMLANLRNQLVAEFDGPDYVFIDSRTGITETGGVCTRYLADRLVILTSLNEQNIQGTARIYKDLCTVNKECILVAANVPVGMPNYPDQLFSKRIVAFGEAFSRPPDLMIYHYPLLSLSEEVPALTMSRPDENLTQNTSALFDTDPLLESYKKLANVIARDRKDELSFNKLLSQTAREWAIDTGTGDRPTAISLLKEHFSGRFLVALLLSAYDVLKDCVEHSETPEKWRSDEFLRLVEVETKITNRRVKECLSKFRTGVLRLLRQYIARGGEMNSSLEVFCTPSDVDYIALREISNGHYSWVIEFYRRSLEQIEGEDSDSRIARLYNLSHALLKTGKRNDAIIQLNRFVEEFRKIDFRNYGTELRANMFFCGALACRELGLHHEARDFCERCRKEVFSIAGDETIFSPIDYKEVSVETFLKQLEAEFPVKELPLATKSHGSSRKSRSKHSSDT